MPKLDDLADAIERSGVLFCTVVTRSHLRYAWVMRESLRRHHPDEPFCVLVVDAPDDEPDGEPVPEEAWFDCPLVPLQAFMTPAIADMTVYYTAYELCGNIKPYFLRYLFDRTAARKIVYLDSDLLVTGHLWAAIATLDAHDVTAAPHTHTPLPEDGKEPSDLTIAVNGPYNTGFMGYRRTPAARELLRWMAERVHRRGFNAMARGMFCEQRFFNLGVTFPWARFQPILLAGYNVGYWNLHERIVTRRAGVYFANDERVTFFHLSGFDLDDEERLSVYDERHTLASHPQAPVLRTLAAEYRAMFAEVPFPPHVGYRFDTYNGLRLDAGMRQHYHQHGTLAGVMSLEDALDAARRNAEAGRHDKAADIYLRILEKLPGHKEAVLGHGMALARLGQRVAARQRFHQLLAIAPGHAEATRQLALLDAGGADA